MSKRGLSNPADSQKHFRKLATEQATSCEVTVPGVQIPSSKISTAQIIKSVQQTSAVLWSVDTVGALTFPSPERLSLQSLHTCSQSCDLCCTFIATLLGSPKHVGPTTKRAAYTLGELPGSKRDSVRVGRTSNWRGCNPPPSATLLWRVRSATEREGRWARPPPLQLWGARESRVFLRAPGTGSCPLHSLIQTHVSEAWNLHFSEYGGDSKLVAFQLHFLQRLSTESHFLRLNELLKFLRSFLRP